MRLRLGPVELPEPARGLSGQFHLVRQAELAGVTHVATIAANRR